MPASGLPVASTITSTEFDRMSASESSETHVVPSSYASPKDCATTCLSVQPALTSVARARSAERSATPTRCMPTVVLTWARNIEPNLPAPTSPTRTGSPRSARARSIRERFIESAPTPGVPYPRRELSARRHRHYRQPARLRNRGLHARRVARGGGGDRHRGAARGEPARPADAQHGERAGLRRPCCL